jgi:geranylgeranyl pyrophosphate synthase
LEDAVLEALGGPTRVLPEGKPNLCAALTYLSYCSAAREESLRVVPAVAAMEMLMAAGDLMDDIQDGEAALPQDRRSLGITLETVSCLLMLCHSAIIRLQTNLPPARVLRGLAAFDALGLDALRGQTLDMDMETRPDVSVEDSLYASRLKSASLTRCAAELGATLGTDNVVEIGLHAQFGWHFGLMMQLMNDIVAVWPGGPNKSDLRLRKKTLPVAFALNLPQESSRHVRLVQSFYESPKAHAASEEEVKLSLWRCGAIHFTWIVAAREKAKAEGIVRTQSECTEVEWPLGKLLH